MTCRELIEFLNDYLSDDLGADERRRFDAHLEECADCVAYLDGYQRTVGLAQDAFGAADAPVPPDVPQALVDAIMAARRRG